MIWNSIGWYKAIREIDDNHSSPLYEISRESTIHPSENYSHFWNESRVENIVFQITFSLNVPSNNRGENSFDLPWLEYEKYSNLFSLFVNHRRNNVNLCEFFLFNLSESKTQSWQCDISFLVPHFSKNNSFENLRY